MISNYKQKGFTIVELLIVIVVIGILAAITIVAYNGIQVRAENNKTIVATEAYIKAIKMYEVDKGEVPHDGMDSCIGVGYPWDYSGASSGSNQCIHVSDSSYYIERAALNNALKSYTGGTLPLPSMQTIGISTNWMRGVTYTAEVVGGNLNLLVAFKGISTCPTIGGISATNPSGIAYSGGIGCFYIVGKRLR